MTEYVYLSSTKLRSFLESPGRLRITKAEGSIKAFGAEGKVSLEDSSAQALDRASYQKLAKVKRHLIDTGRSLLWYEDANVNSGDWIEFEANLGLTSAESGGNDIVLFASPAHRSGPTALLLHGSPSSLIEHIQAAPHEALSTGSSARSVARLLSSLASESSDQEQQISQDRYSLAAKELLENAQDAILGFPFMEGWARVTAQFTYSNELADGLRRLVIATPLYVRFSEKSEFD